MVGSIDFRPYLQSLCRHYAEWWTLYTLTDVEGKKAASSDETRRIAPFDFGLMVQSVKNKAPEASRQERSEKPERQPVLKGLRDSLAEAKQVLLIGRPGSGKSSALARLLLEEAQQSQETIEKPSRIPVLVELRYYQTSVIDLMREFFKRHDLLLEPHQVETLLSENRLLLLIDGLNELSSKEAARQDIAKLRNHRHVPMIFTTRDLSLGGDFGIEKQWEMLPLTETQMQAFIRSHLSPKQADDLWRQLEDRTRKFAETPLLLWMLCELFQTGEEIPRNLGEVFRIFTRTYENSSIRKHEVAALKGDVQPLSDRCLWFLALKHLAYTMMQGATSVDSRTVISRAETEREFKALFRDEPHPAKTARDCLDDLLNYHLLQIRTDDEIEFRHQLLQEYYAAEWLLDRLSELSDEQLKYYFLNYLKWTEAIGLMLGLIDENDFGGRGREQAIRVVKLALGIDSPPTVDLMLGARLAGEVKEEFQEKTIELIDRYQFENGQQAQNWLKLELFAESRSDAAVPKIKRILDTDEEVAVNAAEMLGRIGTPAATQALLQALQHVDSSVRYGVSEALGETGSEEAIWGLRMALYDADLSVVCTAVDSLNKIGSPKIVPILIEALQCPSGNVTQRAISGLKQFNSPEVTEVMKNLLQHEHNHVRWTAAWILSERCGEEMLPYIVELSKDPDWQVRKEALEIMEKLRARESRKNYQHEDSRQINRPIDVLICDFQNKNFNTYWEAYRQLKNAPREQVIFQVLPLLEHKDPGVRGHSADLLGEIGSQQEISTLISRLNCENDVEVRREIAFALGKLGSVDAVYEIVKALKHKLWQRRLEAVDILGALHVEETIPYLIQALEDDAEEVRLTVAEILGNLRIEQAVPRLAQALKDSHGGVKVNAAIALIRIGSEAAFLHLIDAWRQKC